MTQKQERQKDDKEKRRREDAKVWNFLLYRKLNTVVAGSRNHELQSLWERWRWCSSS